MIHLFTPQDKTELIERFMRYCRIDTQSSGGQSDTLPSTAKQFDLATVLVDELALVGIPAILSERCYVCATIPGNAPSTRVIGFLAHLDTTPCAPATNVNPIVHRAISGDSLPLPSGAVIPKRSLSRYAGQDIITSDGSTLLGADDKAGIAAIMQLATILQREKDTIPHGDIKICFSPDEELGNEPKGIDLTIFNPSGAYTIDGGSIGEIEYETFSKEKITIQIDPVESATSSFPSPIIKAKDVAVEFVQMLAKVSP